MNNVATTRAWAIFFQAVLVIVGLCALTFLLVEPHFEGRNASATFFEVYFIDALLAYAYAASIPFFVALYRAFHLAGDMGRNALFQQSSVQALRTIKFCAMTMVPLIILGATFILIGESDDRPPIIGLGAITTLATIAVAVVTGMLESVVKSRIGAR